MTFGQLRTFVEVARAGSIRGAAAGLIVTEPTVSAAVSALQRELGVALLEREGRGVRLTPAGRELARYAAEILGLADTAARRVRETAGMAGRLHLAAVTTAGEYVLPPILKVFRVANPEVQVRMEVGNRATTLELLLAREADLAIGGRPPKNAGVAGEAFLDNHLVVVAAPGHPLARGTSVDRELLGRETWLMRESGSGTRQTTEEFLAALGVESPSVMTLGSNGAVKQAAAAGLGVTLLSTHAVAAELATGTLARLPVRGAPLVRSWYVLYLSGVTVTGSALGFLELLRSPDAARAVDDWLGPSREYLA